MKSFIVEIVVAIEATNQLEAWQKASDLVSNFNGTVSVSEPEEVVD